MKTHRELLTRELLCIADTYWVLGHWYIKCMLNGRSIADFNSLAGFAQDTLGNTRAIFSFLEETYDMPEHQLEFGRDAWAIQSMGTLDAAPESWGDFVMTAYLVECAVWKATKTMQSDAIPEIKMLLRRLGESLYYREIYIEGWIDAFSREERDDAARVASRRLSETFAWFEGGVPDPLVDAGIRTGSLADARTAWLEKIRPVMASATGKALDESRLPESTPDGWDRAARRPGRPVPAGLWEFMMPSSDEALLARRPLAVSITDNLDLFSESA
ncbi:MAG: Phenylacetic acid catabolic protein [Candidimonas sp.]